jgi:hypothetical protein
LLGFTHFIHHLALCSSFTGFLAVTFSAVALVTGDVFASSRIFFSWVSVLMFLASNTELISQISLSQ